MHRREGVMVITEAQTPQAPKSVAEAITSLAHQYTEHTVDTLVPLLPLLTLKGEPYTLSHHAPFEPLFDLSLPKRTTWKTGRQVSKTTGLSSQSVLHCAIQPYFATLFVAPRFEQIRRVSANYVKPFIENSILDKLIAGKSVERSVLQKTFRNEARMYFSFAFLDVDRIRGLSVDCVKYDEIQDIDTDFIPIIKECMSASRYGIEMFFGTPKTLDNTIQVLWERSSQAEWVTRCQACNHENIPGLEYHLLKMIGPRGPVCAKCGRDIQPRTGRWIHANPDELPLNVGYHVPQIIMPMHYEDLDEPWKLQEHPTEKWLDLLGKREGRNNYTEAKFLNEVLGESCDVGTKLVTLTDIKRVATLNKNTEKDALRSIHNYLYRAMGVDWGGGGEDEISFTVVTVVGMNPQSGKMECIFAKRLHLGYSHIEEAQEVMRLFKAFQCHYFCHDYGGSGSVREALMIQSGFPIEKILPFMYVRATVNKMVEAKRPGGFNQRAYYTVDKARSLVLQAQCIKTQAIQLFKYDSESQEILHDLLALIEAKSERPGAADVFLITRNAKMPDDFAHALNFACIGIWHVHKAYPDLTKLTQIKLTPEQRNFADPVVQDWNE